MPEIANPARRTFGGFALALAITAGLGTACQAGSPTRRLSKDLTVPPAVQSQDGYNRDVRVHNQTGWTMTYFFASSSGSGAWGNDLLGSGTLGPGASVVLTIDNGSGACRYDFRGEFDNGESLDRTDINVCQIADYYFTR
jgi:hypothetical protein